MKKYCVKELREQDGKMYYKCISEHYKAVKMYYCSPKKIAIYEIDVREAQDGEETPYYGWLDNEGNISMIYPNYVLFEVCFAYGHKAEENAGRGRMIKVVITEIGLLKE